MKTILLSLLAVASIAATTHASPDPAAQLLSRHGSVAIANAGSHVSLGTFRIQVAAKLGKPDATLTDGTWLYRGRRIKGSNAQGTLIVRFAEGRVSSLALATDTVVAELRADPSRRASHELVAAK